MNQQIFFPDPQQANPDGLLAIGGDLSVERLLLAYRSGIFPWYSTGEPILWYSPDPRFVLLPNKLRISKSMKKLLRACVFTVTFNQQFEEVINQCAHAVRAGQDDTWITHEMQLAYIALHKLGIAKSVEVWQPNATGNLELVGGLYGVDLGNVFCGESMFTKVPNASKYGFIKWVQYLESQNYKLIDCQVYTEHLESLGAEEMHRADFLSYLKS